MISWARFALWWLARYCLVSHQVLSPGIAHRFPLCVARLMVKILKPVLKKDLWCFFQWMSVIILQKYWTFMLLSNRTAQNKSEWRVSNRTGVNCSIFKKSVSQHYENEWLWDPKMREKYEVYVRSLRELFF